MLLRSRVKRLSATSLIVVAGVLTQSADSHAFSRHKQGYYEGQLKVFREFPKSKTDQGPLGYAGSGLVALQIKRSGKFFHAWDGTIDLTDANTGKPVMEPIRFSKEFSIRGAHLWKMNMKLDALLNRDGKETEIEFRQNGECLDGVAKTKDYTATICMRQNNTLTFNIHATNEAKASDPVLELTANPMSKAKLPEGRPLTLKDAIRIALATSPASKAEMLQKLAAKKQMQLAWLNLLPKVNGPAAASLWWPLPTTPQSWVQNIGSVAPFLSINAWNAVDEARKNSEIVDIGFRVFQANLVNLVEQAVYTYRRDVLLTSEYNTLLAQIQGALDQMKKIKDLEPSAPYISADEVEDVNQAIQSAQDIVKDASIANSLANDKHAVAQALGINNLEIVRDIKIGPESVPLTLTTQKVDINPEADKADYTSLKYLELLQADKAIADVRGQRVKHPFMLFDFAGNPSDGIGFNLIAELALDKIAVKTAQANKEVAATWVRFSALNAAENYNDSIDGYKNAIQARDRLKARLEVLLKPIGEFDFTHPKKIGLALDRVKGETIETVVKDYLLFINQTRNYHAAFRLARATLERAKLEYDYEQLKPEADRSRLDSSQPAPVVAEDDLIVDDNQIDNEKDTGTSYRIALPTLDKVAELP